MATAAPTLHVIRFAGADNILRGLASRARGMELRSIAVRLLDHAAEAAHDRSDHAEIGRRAYSLFTGRPWPAPPKQLTDTEEQHRLALWRANEIVWKELMRIGKGGPF